MMRYGTPCLFRAVWLAVYRLRECMIWDGLRFREDDRLNAFPWRAGNRDAVGFRFHHQLVVVYYQKPRKTSDKCALQWSRWQLPA